MSPLQRGEKIRSGYLTPTFSGVPNVKKRGQNQIPKTYARGNNDAPSISKYGSLVQYRLSAPPERSPVGHGSKKMPGAHPARQRSPLSVGH